MTMNFPNLAPLVSGNSNAKNVLLYEELSDALLCLQVLEKLRIELGDEIVYKRGSKLFFGIDNDHVTYEFEITKEQAEAMDRRIRNDH